MSKPTESEIDQLISAYFTPDPSGAFIGVSVLSRKTGFAGTTIIRCMNQRGVALRTPQEALLHKSYRPQKRNLPPGAAPLCACGCGQSVKWISNAAIWQKYATGHYRKDALYKNKEWLYDNYITQQRTTYAIADEYEVSPATITKFLQKFGIKRRRGAESLINCNRSGDNNPAWKNGISRLHDGRYFSNLWQQMASMIYTRDNYNCARCQGYFTTKGSLHAHHIHPWAEDNDMQAFLDLNNLITLCAKCHMWVHSRANTEHTFLL